MISCLWLERPGAWRLVGVAGVLVLAALPAAPLFWQAVSASGSVSLENTFGTAIWNSVVVALVAGVIAFGLGLPAGVLSALYEFPGRVALFLLSMLPALVPSFLWTIGWASLTARIGPAATGLISGLSGCVLVFLERVFKLTETCKKVMTPLRAISSQGRRSRNHGRDELSQRCHE